MGQYQLCHSKVFFFSSYYLLKIIQGLYKKKRFYVLARVICFSYFFLFVWKKLRHVWKRSFYDNEKCNLTIKSTLVFTFIVLLYITNVIQKYIQFGNLICLLDRTLLLAFWICTFAVCNTSFYAALFPNISLFIDRKCQKLLINYK